MEEAFQITSTMKWALNKLSSLIPRASSSSSSKKRRCSAEQELHQLDGTMKWIHATLEDAEERNIIDKSEQLRLSELREVAYDIEDAIDEYEYEVLRVKVKARRMAMAAIEDDKRDKVLDWNSFCPEVHISDDLIDRMREIGERFLKITDDWNRISLGFLENERKRRCIPKWMPIETTSFLDGATTFGRKDEKDKIIEWLLQERNEPNGVSVLAIIGMGGIGKTTLAQLVFDDPRVSKNFDLSAWVCVSEDFDVGDLVRKIINSLSINREPENLSNMSLDALCRCLKDKVEGKKFFIVLDDVWDQQSKLWQSLKNPLNVVGFGKLILTTRNVAVAKVMQTTQPIILKDLPFDDCLSLFVRIAFQGRDHNLHPNLIDIGRRIVKKCKGLPLAVKVLAGILCYEDEEEIWNDILESDLWEVESENNNVLPILELSYKNMPVRLRPCFMYLSLFSKDSILVKETVVEQWMSQGFLQDKGKRTEEEVGNSYFEEFLQRSILQRNITKQFVMHDLIHDLVLFVAKDEYLLITSNKLCRNPKNIPRSIRHISVYLKDDFDITLLRPLFESKSLRTLLIQKASQFQTVEELCNLIDGSYHNLKCLRTLILNDRYDFNGQYRMLPDVLRHLKHLRYLNITKYVSTAEHLSSLYHLQTFISWTGRVELCSGIGDLINLRHLDISDCSYMHHEIGWLTDLQKLGCFKVGAESWQCKLGDLKGLASLRGLLRISGLENVKCSEMVVPGTFKDTLQGVKRLELLWNGGGENEMDENEKFAEHVLDCFQTHRNLLQLYISGYPCAVLPTWLGNVSFSELQSLHISGSNCTSLPTLGQLPALKGLVLRNMKRVKIVGRELLQCSRDPVAATRSLQSGCCFPSLEYLEFIHMEGWEEWNGVELCDFPRLRTLEIYYCPKLKALPTLLSVTTLVFPFQWNPELLLSCSLPMLRTLQFEDLPESWGRNPVPSLAFPDYQILRSIKELVIFGEAFLTSIEGIGNLTSLEHLEIECCGNARISPNEQLPLGLRVVKILDSPEVERWYKNQVLKSGGSVDTQQVN